MKPLFFALFSFFIIAELYGQHSTGKVIDSESSLNLSNVIIKNSDGTFSIITDETGAFTLPNSDTYVFSKNGYSTKTIAIKTYSKIIVALVTKTENLNEVIITSNNFKSKLKTLPAAVSVINTKTINSNNSVNIAPILNTVPGVFMHNGTLTTNRITIRGIGSRNLFGTSKIRAYYQDIPLTNGSGASTIEDIEMSALGSIEILKGPSSSIYGSGLGGTIQLIPLKDMFNKMHVNSSFTFGSFGLRKYVVQSNLSDLKNAINLTYTNIHSDGYRKNNETDRQTFAITTNHYLGAKDKLSFVGNYIDFKAFIPSSLNEDNYLNNPTSAAFTWGKARGFEDYKKGLFGLSWQHDYNLKTKQYTSIFTSFLDSYEPRPFNILKENTNGIGLRSRVASRTDLFNNLLEWTVGGELFMDTNSYQTYENLYEDFPSVNGSVEGDLLSSFKEKRFYFNVFFDSKYHLSNKTMMSFGLNANKTSYTLSDKIKTEIDASGDYDFKTIVSPKIGVTQQISKSNMVYATISHGFSPPTLEETLLPDGLINPNIKPESGWNYEIGSRGSIFKSNLHYDVALYKMNVKNLLVARRTANDEFVGINAGKTTYNGLELALSYHLIKTEKINITHSNNLTYNDFKFKDFIDDTNDFSGNDLTGVPDISFNSNINLETALGFYAFINYNYVGKMPLRDDNSVYSDTYQLVHTKFGYKSNLEKKFQLDVFVGINNLFDQTYASMLLINAGSFGGNAPRYYYPGEPTNYYAGLNLKYLF